MTLFKKKSKILIFSAVTAVTLVIAFSPLPFFEIKSVEADNHYSSYQLIASGIGKVADLAGAGVDVWKKFWETAAMMFGMLLLNIGGWILGLAGLLVDAVIEHTIVGMKAVVDNFLVDNLNGLEVAWRGLRDMANMFFIFILLYIAIATILRLDSVNTKKLLVHVIIIALLLNFSLFFTKVIIDVSNTLAIAFYNGIKTAGGDQGVAGAFMQPLGLTSFWDPAGAAGLLLGVEGFANIFLLGILGFVLFSVVAFVFFAASVLLIMRFVILIFLMILSPLAFAAMALPKDEYSKKWWGALFSQCIWVPALMALLWVALLIVSPATGGKLIGDTGARFTDLIPNETSNPDSGTIVLLMNFVIVIGSVIFSLIAAKQIGAIGGSTMVKWGGKTANYVGGGLAGATARTALQPTRFAYDKLKRTRLGQSALVSTPLDATLGSFTKMKIGTKSLEEAHREGIERRSSMDAVKKVREARISLKEAEKTKDEEKIKRAKEELELAEDTYKRHFYTKDMWNKERNIKEQNKRLEELRREREDERKLEKRGAVGEGKAEHSQTTQTESEGGSSNTSSKGESKIVSGDSVSVEHVRQENEKLRNELISTGKFTEEQVEKMPMEEVRKALNK